MGKAREQEDEEEGRRNGAKEGGRKADEGEGDEEAAIARRL